MRRSFFSLLLAAGVVTAACASIPPQPNPAHPPTSPEDRSALVRRAQVWAPTDIGSMNLMTGPAGPGSFAPRETVACDYVERVMEGNSPKFTCEVPSKPGAAAGAPDDVKVKYGIENGEVYGEVASTRLLWALGFGADRMYPVRVVCRGCPEKYKANETLPSGERVFDPAVIERKMTGRTIESKPDQGWSWKELDLVSPEAGGAPPAHRDALKLLAVILQHGDSKSQQQRLICLDPKPAKGEPVDTACDRPFMLINDLGLTWGEVDNWNRNSMGGVSYARWTSTAVWKSATGCVGNLSKAWTGTLGDPVISEEGRQFLAGLLAQLSDGQIHDLFAVSQVALRPSAPNQVTSAATSVEMWVAAFKQKRAEVSGRTCGAAQ